MYTVQGAGSSCECFRFDNDCFDEVLAQRAEYFQRDIDDIADSVMQVMRICGIVSWLVEKARPAIKQAMVHYDEIRFRVDRVPRKRFCREDFIHDVAHRCQMSRMDSQLAYSIVKHAFKAYYHGTALEGVRLLKLTKRMYHKQQCLWLHAAKSTAETYAIYAGLMLSEQLQYEERIECVYYSLFEVLKKRLQYDDERHCICSRKPPITFEIQDSDNSSDFMDYQVPTQHALTDSMYMEPSGISNALKTNNPKVLKHFCKSQIPQGSYELLGETATTTARQSTKHASKHASKHVSKYVSQHSKMYASNYVLHSHAKASNVALAHASLNATSDDDLRPQRMNARSQSVKMSVTKHRTQDSLDKSTFGSRKHCNCRPMQCLRQFESERPEITAECSQGPYVCRWLPLKDDEQFKEHYVPCPPMEVICPPCTEDPCDKLCTCTCQFCQCEPAYLVGGEEEHHGDKLSATGIEDQDTDYCFVAPFRSKPRIFAEQAAVEVGDVEPLLMSEHSFEPHECKCVCEYKRRAYPHLFTWLAPLSDKLLAEPEPITAEEPPRPAPCNITPATHDCWTRSTPTASDTSSENEKPSVLLLSSARKAPPASPAPQATQARPAPPAGMTIDVTVKNQHQNGKVLQHQQIDPQKSAVPASAKRNSAAATAKTGSTAAVAAPKPAVTTKPSATTAQPAATAQDTMTKEDILDIIGLK